LNVRRGKRGGGKHVFYRRGVLSPGGRLRVQADNHSRTRGLFIAAFFAVAMVVAVNVVFAWHRTRTMPEFYQEALNRPAESWVQAGADLQSQLLQLNTDLLHQEIWQAEFSSEQINAWLVLELPERFPDTLPPQMSDPRIAFIDDEIRFAFRVASSQFSGVVNGRAQVYCTDEPSQLAVEIQSLSSGLIPLPISPWAEAISEGFAQQGIGLTWSQQDGNPLALVDLPDKFLNIHGRRVSLDAIVVQDELLMMSGESLPDSRRMTLYEDDQYDHVRFSRRPQESFEVE